MPLSTFRLKGGGALRTETLSREQPPTPHFSAQELARLKNLLEKGKRPAEIATLMGRDLSNVYHHFQRHQQGGAAPRPVGRPPALNGAQVDKVVDTTETMVVVADGKYQVTAKMVLDAPVVVLRLADLRFACAGAIIAGRPPDPRSTIRARCDSGVWDHGTPLPCPIVESLPMRLGCRMTCAPALKLKCSVRRVHDALRSRSVRFRPMREKPIRTADDEKDRLAFGNRHAKKPPSYWVNGIHAYLDNKMFPIFPNVRGRAYAAKRTAHGTYRARGQGLAKGNVKPRKSQKVTFGKGVNVAVAISAKKVLMCHVVPERWTAAEASVMYSESLAPALRRAYPCKRRFLLLEDNDPSGNKSKLAAQTKVDHSMDVLGFPKRSPDLNPVDYGFWDCVNRRLRKQEAAIPSAKKETRAPFVARLKRTILRVPEAVLTPLVKSMGRRCKAVQRVKGKDFAE